jgi:hypothetical protein
MSLRITTTLIALIAVLAAPSAARAELVAGAVSDEGGRTDNGQQDIRNAVVVYDTSGVLRGAFVLAEPPAYTGVSDLQVEVGTWSKKRGWCSNKADVDLFPPDDEVPEWFGGLLVGAAEDGPDALISAQGSSVAFEVAAPEIAQKRWNCAWAITLGPAEDPKTQDWRENDRTKVFSLTAQEAQRPEAPPKCGVRSRRVQRRGKIRLRCSNVSGSLTIRLYRDNRLKRAVKARVGRGGRVAVSTRGLRRGEWGVRAWRGSDVLGYGQARVR